MKKCVVSFYSLFYEAAVLQIILSSCEQNVNRYLIACLRQMCANPLCTHVNSCRSRRFKTLGYDKSREKSRSDVAMSFRFCSHAQSSTVTTVIDFETFIAINNRRDSRLIRQIATQNDKRRRELASCCHEFSKVSLSYDSAINMKTRFISQHCFAAKRCKLRS